MPTRFNLGEKLPGLVDRYVAAYESQDRLQHVGCAFLPAPTEVHELIDRILELLLPGFFGRQDLTRHNVRFHVGELLPRIGTLVYRQIHKCLCYQAEIEDPRDQREAPCDQKARQVTLEFIDRLLICREILAGDVSAAYDGDPAAVNYDEVVLAYPGLLAVAVYRVAHELYSRGVPLLPRMISEWAHRETGVDIHPGARIGRNFFIDHGTGVVIGETTEIGDNVKLYQGVTLGALSFPRDERGRVIRGQKRHPTVEDDVTIYANAIILGKDTVLGKGCVIGGSVFLTSSVPAGATVTITPPALRMHDRSVKPTSKPDGTVLDFQI